MLFNSYEFILLFLPITLVFYLVCRQFGWTRLSLTWLVTASLFFYGWWNPAYLILILASVIFNFLLGMWMSSVASKKLLLLVGIAANLALLFYYKYATFFIGTWLYISTGEFDGGTVFIPLAISFFTFQQIAYLVDLSKGYVARHNLLDYFIFVTFFPQLIAGPIVHHSEMMPQFKKLPRESLSTNLAIGLAIFTMGLFKKVVIADNLALIATPIFSDAEQGMVPQVLDAWNAIMAYSFQLYFDFSGYSDMAIGLARMFGIRLPLNFNSPYKATSISDFWRRWHITLSRFLRDYLYIPLGGNQQGKARRYSNLLITMLLGGLWHGAGWTFVFWGGLHGFYLIINHAWKRFWRVSIGKWWSKLMAQGVTLFFVMIAWVFFRAESFQGALTVLKGLINLPETFYSKLGAGADILSDLGFSFKGHYLTSVETTNFMILLLLLVFVLVAPNTQELFKRYSPAFNFEHKEHSFLGLQKYISVLRFQLSAVLGIWVGLLFSLVMLSFSKLSEFLYFQF